jgi:hypothetical protein
MGEGGRQDLTTRFIASVLFLLAALLRVNAQPVNDNLAGATRLFGDHITASGSNAGATVEPHEPIVEQKGGASIWYAWKASASGMITVSTAGSDFDTFLAIFSIDANSNLTKLAFSDDIQDATTSLARSYVIKSAEYRFLVDGYHGATGHVALSLDLDTSVVPIDNDNYADAVSIGDPASYRALNYLATSEPDELRPIDEANRSVWWDFVALTDYPIVVSTVGSDFDTVLAIYDGKKLVAWDDDTVGSNETLRFPGEFAKSYRIAVYGYDQESGLINLQIHTEIPLTTSLEGQQIVLRWPAIIAGYFLESCSLGDFNWTPVSATITQTGDQNEVRLPLDAVARAFRLSHK